MLLLLNWRPCDLEDGKSHQHGRAQKKSGEWMTSKIWNQLRAGKKLVEVSQADGQRSGATLALPRTGAPVTTRMPYRCKSRGNTVQVQGRNCGAFQLARILDLMTREAIHLSIVRTWNMDRSQRDPRPQTPLKNFLYLPAQPPGPSPSRSVQIVHHDGVIHLNQDMCPTQPPLESRQGEENTLHLEILREDWSFDHTSRDNKEPQTTPHP